MTLSRRALLRLLPISALALTACVEDPLPGLRLAGQDAGGAALRDGSGDAVLDQTQPPPPRPPALQLFSRTVAQGGAFLALLSGDGIASASAEFRDWVYPTVQENGAFLGIIPAGQLIGDTAQPPPGVYPVTMRYQLTDDATDRLLDSTITVTRTDFLVEYLEFTPEVATLLDPALAEQEVRLLRAAYGTFRPPRLWDGYFLRPSPAPISDPYGSRRSYQGGPVTGSHSGVDFGAQFGSPVTAAANGRVVQARPMPTRGNMIILDHGAGVFTGYCHLSQFWVAAGESVRAGDQIGAVGATGLVTGPHLHWEVVGGGQHLDGLRWLAP